MVARPSSAGSFTVGHRTSRGGIGWFIVVLPDPDCPRDLAMQDLDMMSLGGIEWSASEWQQLLESAGLVLGKMWINEEGPKHATIEAVLPGFKGGRLRRCWSGLSPVDSYILFIHCVRSICQASGSNSSSLVFFLFLIFFLYSFTFQTLHADLQCLLVLIPACLHNKTMAQTPSLSTDLPLYLISQARRSGEAYSS